MVADWWGPPERDGGMGGWVLEAACHPHAWSAPGGGEPCSLGDDLRGWLWCCQPDGSARQPASAPGNRNMLSPDLYRALRRLNALLRPAVASAVARLPLPPG